jgi:hypothetical protein
MDAFLFEVARRAPDSGTILAWSHLVLAITLAAVVFKLIDPNGAIRFAVGGGGGGGGGPPGNPWQIRVPDRLGQHGLLGGAAGPHPMPPVPPPPQALAAHGFQPLQLQPVQPVQPVLIFSRYLDIYDQITIPDCNGAIPLGRTMMYDFPCPSLDDGHEFIHSGSNGTSARGECIVCGIRYVYNSTTQRLAVYRTR